MNEMGLRRIPPDQSSGSGYTFGTLRHPSIADQILSKRVCFYKSGDPQFNGLRLVINNRTFKTFDALLDNLSKKVPLAFGVRNITTPHGVHAIRSLDELEDGKSYICSDRRKVKPINLALARKKLPPWYHARPVSSRRQTVQQARFFPGRSTRKTQPPVLRTPKRLLVFCNGEPSIKQTVVLQKKITPNYESILEYISELMQFHVVKLHTLDGKRVDGLPGLILCSGTVVAAGREPFKPANYKALKTPPARRHTRRKKSLNRKKKSRSYASDIRNFSPSSERYIVDKIHNTIAGNSYSVPSYPTNSVELESSRMLESVAETEEDNNLEDGAEGQVCSLPSEDDIEKSFRVNQDGSMTVEMRVRLTIKEEETVHWTTTLTRSCVANQLSTTCLSEPEPADGICSTNSTSLNLQSYAESSNDTISKDKTYDNNDEDPPSFSNEAFSESCNEEDEFKTQTAMMFPRRSPTPGHKQIRKKQTSVESIKSVTANGIQEDVVGSYSFREQAENGSMAEQYCMVKQSSSRPVPKPRRLGSVEQYTRNVTRFKSEGMSEVLQIGSSGEEVTETVLHIYEQQTCQDNFLANIYAPFMSASETTFGRPATSETGRVSCSNDFEPDPFRPSTASESISIWRTESMSVTSDRKSPPQKYGANKTTNAQKRLQRSSKGQVKAYPGEANKDKRVSSNHKLTNKHVRRIMTPSKRQNKNPANASGSQKKAKTFSSAGYIKRIYGNKSKSAKSLKSSKSRTLKNGIGSVSKNSLPDDTINDIENVPSSSNGYKKDRVSFETSRMGLSSSELSQPRGVLTRQASMHMEKNTEDKSYNNNPSSTQSVLGCTSNSTNEYVENWLETAHLNQQRENIGFVKPENKQDFTEAEDINCFVETLKTDTHQSCESQPANALGTSVKLKVQSFENKSFSPPVEKTAGSPNIALNHINSINTDNSRSSLHTHAEDTKPLPINDIGPEIQFESEKENKSNPGRISFQKASPSNTLSIDLPPPPSSAEIAAISDPEYFIKDVSSVASSPLYRLSSSRTDTHSGLVSPTSDEVLSFNESPMEITSSVQANIPSDVQESPIPRVPSIKRATLVSNTSLERKMSLRKASLDKYTLSTDVTSEMNTLSTTVSTTSDDVPLNAKCSTRTEQPIKALPEETLQTFTDLISTQSGCTSVSPASLTSGERVSSPSILSSEDLVPSSLSLKDTKNLKGGSSPKTLVKKVKLMSSPSPERKPLSKKFPVEQLNNSPKLSSVQSRSSKNMLPDVGIQRRATPNPSSSAERKQKLYKPKQQKRLSPYSQSLDVVSPPTKHKSSKKLLLRNISSDSPSGPTKTKKVLPTRATGESVKPAAELDKALMSDTPVLLEADQREKHNDGSKTVVQPVSQPFTTENQLNMKPVLEKICCSIKSIRQITQSKRPSCLEKSNSLPDFSSHVASTFGSSSKALLAFLSVITLKEGITNLNMDELNTNNVSCAEALKMIDSLTEIANIEDSHTLKTSLSELQQSTSKQLLQSWKGFQELSDRCKSRSSSASNSEQEHIISASPDRDCNLEESVIDELMDSLDVPEKLKVELASLSAGAMTENTEQISESIKGAKLHSIEKCNNYVNQLSAEDVINAPQDDTVTVDVRSMIKKFSHITQPDQSSTGNLYLAEKSKTVDQSTQDTDFQHTKTKCPQEEHFPAGKQVYSESSEQDNLLSCKDEVHEEDRDKSKQKNDNRLTQDNTNMTGVNSSKTNLEEDSCDSNSEKQDFDCSALQKSMNESSHLGKKTMIAEESSSQNDDCKQSASTPNTDERNRSEEAETEDFLTLERQSEEDEAKQSSPCHYVEVNLKEKDHVSSTASENQVTGVVKCKEMCNSSDRETQHLSMGLNGSVDDSTEASDDVDGSSSEEEQPEVEFKQLQVIVEETSSGIEEEEEEVEHAYIPPQNRELTTKFNRLEALNEETEEDNASSGDEFKTYICHQSKQQSIGGKGESILLEKDNSFTKNDKETKSFKFNTDDDSGNDHRSYEEHGDEDRPQLRYEQLSCSMEDLSYDDKEFNSDEEKVNMSHTQAQCPTTQKQSDAVKCEIKTQNEMTRQSVAERVILLEQQAAGSQTWKCPTRGSADRQCPQRNVPPESEEESSSDSPTSLHAFCTRSAPQSSLSFSYDSSGVITTEPEGRVRSIREMFLAKSSTDVQQRRVSSLHASDLLENRGETSVGGGGYQTHTSSESSSGEDDSARQSITKGFVRRTIERLYGKKDAPPNEEAGERSTPAPKQRNKEHSSIFSSLQTAGSKAMSELSYFNSSNALDTLTGATRCIAFNAQVGPGDSFPIDNGRWLLRENTLIRKSVSDPVGINKAFSNDPECEKACEMPDEHTPYSLFSSKSDIEDKTKSFSRKCTYFSLPHCSDSDACQDEGSKGSLNGDAAIEAKDDSEDSKTWAEKNCKLPSVSLTDYKMMDNKVHPLTEPPPDPEVVLVQPGKGQGVVNRRLHDPDMLDFLYDFCGQNCPIL